MTTRIVEVISVLGALVVIGLVSYLISNPENMAQFVFYTLLFVIAVLGFSALLYIAGRIISWLRFRKFAPNDWIKYGMDKSRSTKNSSWFRN